MFLKPPKYKGIILLFFSVFVFCFFAVHYVHADTITWNGAGTNGTCGVGHANDWSCDANWAGGVAPTSADDVVFDGTSTKNATIDSSISITRLIIQIGYTGTITQASGVTIDIITGTGDMDQYDGHFVGGNGNINLTGTLFIDGGTFVATSGTTTVNFNFEFDGGTFNPNNGNLTVGEHFILDGGVTFTAGSGTLAVGFADVTYGGEIGQHVGYELLNATFTPPTIWNVTSGLDVGVNGSTTTINGTGKTLNFIGDAAIMLQCDGNFNSLTGITTVNIAQTSDASGFILQSQNGVAGCDLTANINTLGGIRVVAGSAVSSSLTSNAASWNSGAVEVGAAPPNNDAIFNPVQLFSSYLPSSPSSLIFNGTSWNSTGLDVYRPSTLDLPNTTTFVVAGPPIEQVVNPFFNSSSGISDGATNLNPTGDFANEGTITYGGTTVEVDNVSYYDIGTFDLTGKNLIFGGVGPSIFNCNGSDSFNSIYVGVDRGNYRDQTHASSIVINKTAGTVPSLDAGSFTVEPGQSSLHEVAGTCPLTVDSISAPTWTDDANYFLSNRLDIWNGTLTINGNVDMGYGLAIIRAGADLIMKGATWTSGTIDNGGTFDASTSSTFNVYGAYFGTGSVSSMLAPDIMNLLIDPSGNFGADFGLDADTDIFTARSGSLNITGSFYGSAGFHANTGSVVLIGTNQFLGTNTGADNIFYNLTKTVAAGDTLTIQNTETETILHGLDLEGAPGGNQLALPSDSSPTRWNIDPSAASSIILCYLDVSDSNNPTALTLQGYHVIDFGHNVGWSFVDNTSCGNIVATPTPTPTPTPNPGGGGSSFSPSPTPNPTPTPSVSPSPTPSITPPPIQQCLIPPTEAITTNLQRHDQGPGVKILQKFLNDNNFILAASGYGSPGNETTYFGPRTQAALKSFQLVYSAQIGNTPADGNLDQATRDFINNLLVLNSCTPVQVPPIGHLDTIHDGPSGDGAVIGWALDADTPLQSIQVKFYIDGLASSNFQGSVIAGLPRPDVNSTTGYPRDHGFTFQIPEQFKDGVIHTLYVFAVDTTTGISYQISGSPRDFIFPLPTQTPINIDIPPNTNFHFLKRLCPSWSVVTGNAAADNLDDSSGHFSQFSNYSVSSPHFPNPYQFKPVGLHELPQTCIPQADWNFKLSTDQAQVHNVSTAGPTNIDGEFVIQMSDLNSAQQSLLRSGGQLWVSEDLQSQYGFAVLRCYNDALNGDNLEYIRLSNNPPADIYCIAYNVAALVSTPTPTPIIAPTSTPTPTATPIPTTSQTPGSNNPPTPTPTPSLIVSGSPSPTPTTTPSPTATPTATPSTSVNPTQIPTQNPGGGGGGGSTITPQATPTPTVSATPTISPSQQPGGGGTLNTLTPTPSVVASPTPLTPIGPPINTVINNIPGKTTTAETVSIVTTSVVIITSVDVLLNLIHLGASILDILLFSMASFFQLIGVKKKNKPWGTVYDSMTKRPIPFVSIELFDQTGTTLETKSTDIDGRYGFLVDPALFREGKLNVQLEVQKENYAFPSHIVTSAPDTLLYQRVYNGGLVEVEDKDFINLDIPIDPLTRQEPKPSKAPSISLNNFVVRTLDIAFWISLVTAPLIYLAIPNLLNLSIMIAVLLMVIFHLAGLRKKPYGVIIDKDTGNAVPFSLITLLDTSGNRAGFAVTDELGRYFLLAQKGLYRLRVDTPSGMTQPRSAERTLSVKNGWVDEKIDL